MRLTKNDRFVLKCLIENGRVSDAEIARKLKITLQGVGKIRKKLENSGIIKGYSTTVDYQKLGINVFAVVTIKPEKLAWEKINNAGSMQNLMSEVHKNTPNLMCLLTTPVSIAQPSLSRKTGLMSGLLSIRLRPFC